MDCSDGEVSLPLTITYAEWKEQQKRWLPNYEVTKPLLPVKKAKKKKKSGLQWPQAARSEENDGSRPLNKPSIEKHVNSPLENRRFYLYGQYFETLINISQQIKS